MEKKKPGRKPSTDWVVVGYDEYGVEIAYIDGLTQKEAEARIKEYPRGSLMKKERMGLNVKCEVKNCNNIAVTMVRPGSLKEAIPVCRYHSCAFYLIFQLPGLRRFEGITVQNKLVLKSLGTSVAPDTLCIRYCPSFAGGACRAYLEPLNKGHAKRLAKAFRGMTILCIEDYWWKL